jgi:molybdopterin-synthase adenylyltransferase
MIPVAKSFVWRRDADELLIVFDPRECLRIPDPSGQVEQLLMLLRDGSRTPAELAAALGEPAAGELATGELATGELAAGEPVTEAEVTAAIEVLDEHRLVESAETTPRFSPAERERYFSNLAFFETFASLTVTRTEYQQRLRDAHVLVLGTGGLNSNTIPHLCGLGVGALTLVDRDAVEPRNFARQYLYRWSQLGSVKVAAAAEWVREFDPTIKVTAHQMEIDGPDSIAMLLDQHRPDIVMDGVDRPDGIDLWVSDVCVGAGVPMVRGGMSVTTGGVWSVDPGRSACRRCLLLQRGTEATPSDAEGLLGQQILDVYATRTRTNRGIGPVAGLLGSLSAFEVLRYLTGFEPPAYAGITLEIDFARGCTTTSQAWQRHPDCPTCAGAPVGAAR